MLMTNRWLLAYNPSDSTFRILVHASQEIRIVIEQCGLYTLFEWRRFRFCEV
jgi:hypothetical protein